MHDSHDSVEMINGVPVVVGPAEIDVTTAEQLRSVLLEAASHGHTTIVVDMTRTRFCDSCGLSVLVRAHKRAFGEGGELRLVIPPDGTVFRIFALTSLYRFIPRFDSLTEALLPRPSALAWNREHTGDPAAGASALRWSVIAMTETIARLPAIPGRDRPRAWWSADRPAAWNLCPS